MTKLAMKAANNVRSLVLLVVFSWLLAGSLFAIMEGVNLLDALYWSMTTMSTVGYGDISATHWYGKILTIIFQAWSIFYLVPCAVANIIDKVRVDEAKFTHDEQEWTEHSIKAIAAKMGVELEQAPSDY